MICSVNSTILAQLVLNLRLIDWLMMQHAAVATRENVYVVGGASVDGQLGDVQV